MQSNFQGQQIKKDYFCFRHFTQSLVWDIFVLDLSTNGFGVSCELKP
jgi:hypothetical protein